MIEIDLINLQKSEARVSVKGHRHGKGYVKPYIRVVKTAAQADAEMDAKLAALQAYKEAASQTNDWIRDNPDRHKDVGATNDYCVSDYDVINTALRDDRTDKELDKMLIGDSIKSISSFLKDAPKFEGTVYRGMTFDIAHGGDKEYEAFITDVESDIDFTLKPFTSTSVNKDEAMKFTSKDNINILMEIKSKRGIALDGAAEFPKEQEVLFTKDSKFKLIDKQISGDDVKLTIEEI